MVKRTMLYTHRSLEPSTVAPVILRTFGRLSVSGCPARNQSKAFAERWIYKYLIYYKTFGNNYFTPKAYCTY
jgi:hypothetical protein